jgi:hypothetical protein
MKMEEKEHLSALRSFEHPGGARYPSRCRERLRHSRMTKKERKMEGRVGINYAISTNENI